MLFPHDCYTPVLRTVSRLSKRYDIICRSNQVLHQILSGFVWEEEALKRAKQSFLQSHETLVKSLEGRSTEMLMDRMSGGDNRFMSIPQEDIEVCMVQDVVLFFLLVLLLSLALQGVTGVHLILIRGRFVC